MKNIKGAGRKSKLTDLEKAALKADYGSGEKIEVIAAKYGVSYSTVLRTVKN